MRNVNNIPNAKCQFQASGVILCLYIAMLLSIPGLPLQAQSLVGFSAIRISNGRDRGDSYNAIDGNPITWSYLTLPFTQGAQTAFLDFGTNASVNGFEWIKQQQNIDGTASDYIHSSLWITISTDSVSIPVASRTFVQVGSMVNGYNGNNCVQIDSGGSFDTNGTITREFGMGIADGLTVTAATYAVTFALITNATAIAFTFQDTDPIVGSWPPYTLGWTHYPTAEFYGISMSSLQATLNGHVTCTCDGSPIANALVQIVDAVNTYSATCASSGNYSIIGILPGTYSATVSANSYVTTNATVTIPSGVSSVTRNFSLSPSLATIIVSAAPAAGGKVTGGGTFASGGLRTVTATANSGYTFANWTENGAVLSFSAIYTFTLNANHSLVANFAVKGNPKLTITSPKSGQSVSNGLLLVTGVASDNVALDDVLYQLNGGSWTLATSGNSWSNWTANVTLNPGPNIISAYAVDSSGSFSPTNSVSVFDVVTAQLVVTNTGKGTISPDYNGQSLAIGSNYSMTAIATTAAGFAFTNWTGGTNQPFSVLTNKPKVTFQMASNLTLIANFVDVTPPTITITSPTTSQRWSNSTFTAMGTAKDNVLVSNVFFQLNGGVWTPATPGSATRTNWTATLTPLQSTNVLLAYAVDTSGNNSPTNTVRFLYIPMPVGEESLAMGLLICQVLAATRAPVLVRTAVFDVFEDAMALN